MNCLNCWKLSRKIGYYVLTAGFLFLPLVASASVDESRDDLDRDGVVDAVDADQDNDGLLNTQEGLLQLSRAQLSVPADYSFIPLQMKIDELGREVRYSLQHGERQARLRGEIFGSTADVNWQEVHSAPKLQHVRPGEVIVEWTLWQDDIAIPFDIDYKISDLDAERQETISVERASIVGYSLAQNSSIEVEEIQNQIFFTAVRNAGGDSNSVLLHVRNRHALRIRYHHSEPASDDVGVRAGFVHSFDSSGMESYTMLPGETDTDRDGTPDHRDTDSNNNGIADVVEAGFVDDVADALNAPVNDHGVPLFESRNVNEVPASTTVDLDGDGLDEQQEWYLGTDKTLFDTDGDGFGDGEEVTVYHTNPVDAESTPHAQTAAPSDKDLDGIADLLETTIDSDGDGIPNDYDLDSDNDGIPDRIEAFTSMTPIDLDAAIPVLAFIDTDNDSIADVYDLDSDDDGLSDLTEAGYSDLDDNGVVDAFLDENSNGWHDLFENNELELSDRDTDGVPDFRDMDGDVEMQLPVLDDSAADSTPPARENSARLATGVNGGGCAFDPHSRDASMLLLLMFSILFCAGSRRRCTD